MPSILDEPRIIRWNKTRTYGLEFEFARDYCDRNVLKRAIEQAGQRAQVRDWEHTRDNHNLWICKTDSSCGWEVCSPPMSGPATLKNVGEVLTKIFAAGAQFNNNCGFHIHLSVQDFDQEKLYSLLAHWIKIEMMIMNSHPSHRRDNPYCKLCNNRISNYDPHREYSGDQLYDVLCRERKQTLNITNYNERKTIEFRMGDMTMDPEDVKNRVRFLIWFTDVCRLMPMPKNLNWFTPKQAMRWLGLSYDQSDTIKKVFTPAVKSMRNWILKRLEANCPDQLYGKDKTAAVEMLKEFEDVDKKITVQVNEEE